MTAETTTKPDITMIGIVCERSVELDDRLDENDCLLDNPSVKIIRVPCSGIIQPIMMETALKKGAKGCFATGCRMGDCHYRDGNRFLDQRLHGTRMPKLKPSVDKNRIEAYWLSAVEYNKLKDYIDLFNARIEQMDDPVASGSKDATAAVKA